MIELEFRKKYRTTLMILAWHVRSWDSKIKIIIIVFRNLQKCVLFIYGILFVEVFEALLVFNMFQTILIRANKC